MELHRFSSKVRLEKKLQISSAPGNNFIYTGMYIDSQKPSYFGECSRVGYYKHINPV